MTVRMTAPMAARVSRLFLLLARFVTVRRARVPDRPSHGDPVATERLRIASELHDVVAHDLSVMTLGVGAGRVIMDKDPERARQTFREAEESGRQVLTDLKRMVALLRVDGMARGPQPRLDEMDRLLDGFRARGMVVSFAEEGARGTGSTLELSAYRIVEEALGNAVRYGRAREGSVTLRWFPAILEVVVQDDGLPRDRLVGTWERAALFGGSVSAHARPGGFEVRVRLIRPS
ncbi:histidine kinase [Planotetraspora sp. A-T 1434]|uniref:sensor histidine kinase n=1 Tax=Planotetraspora sp. A-T 1434 TaxID=2979219 RepID=UPI0021BF62CD|nr:histidine kinase [Planotetraspora sp. A-T 1434]MCT9930096.1 histidine kinase [Planotetraspora sp. A-T 1434]